MFKIKAIIINFIYQNLVRPILFLIDSETVHNYFLQIGSLLGICPCTRKLTKWLFDYQHPSLSQTITGIKFKNPVGLAAGFDKDFNLTQVLPEIGFGYMEGGTITAKPYAGNPPPRLFRLPKSKGIVVYFGLKNIGVQKIIAKLSQLKFDFPLGISVGKTNSPDTKTTLAGVEDYYQCLKKLHQHNLGDYYTINISCPNTFGGEPFTTPDRLDQLLIKLTTLKIKKPIFLKMPINLTWPEFKKLLDIAIKYKINGMVIGNLNKNRQDQTIKDIIPDHIQGGISGKPTWNLSNKLISRTYQYYGNKLIIVGVGGIFSAADAYEKIKRGASLVQLITGMIYQGPQMIGQINQELVKLLRQDGYSNVSEAIGSYYR